MTERDRAVCQFGHGTAEQYPTDALRWFVKYADRAGYDWCVSCANAADYVLHRRAAERAVTDVQLPLF